MPGGSSADGVVEPKPPGMVLDPQTGRLTWTPTTEQARGDKQIISVGTPDAMPRYVKEYQVTVFAATPDRRDETALVVSVTAPAALEAQAHRHEDRQRWRVDRPYRGPGKRGGLEGKVRYSLAPDPTGHEHRRRNGDRHLDAGRGSGRGQA